MDECPPEGALPDTPADDDGSVWEFMDRRGLAKAGEPVTWNEPHSMQEPVKSDGPVERPTEGALPNPSEDHGGSAWEFLDRRDLAKAGEPVTWDESPGVQEPVISAAPVERNGLTNRNGIGPAARNGNGPVKWNGNGGTSGNGLSSGRGLVNGNGLVNGAGKGLSSGRGLVNGNGLINGNGLVNGNSFVNGAGKGLTGGGGLINGNGLVNGCQNAGPGGNGAHPGGNGRRGPAARGRLRLLVMVIASAALVVMVPLLAFFSVSPAGRLTVDGDFSDWDGKAALSDGPDASMKSADLDIVRYATAVSENEVFFFVQVAGRMMPGKGNGAQVVNVLIDADRDASTGYSIRGIGADNRVEVYGFDGMSRSCTFYRFSLAKGKADWNGWTSLGPGKASAANRGLELSIWKSGLSDLDEHRYRALFLIADTVSGAMDSSRMLAGPERGALLIEQRALDIPTLEPASVSGPVLRFSLESFGGNMRLEALVLERSGNASAADVGELELRLADRTFAQGRFRGTILVLRTDLSIPSGRTENIDLYVRIVPGAPSGAVLGIGLLGHESAAVTRGTVTVDGFGLRSFYIGAPPAGIDIDGAFGDWARIAEHPDASGDCGDPCTDLLDGRAVKDRGSLSFLARVDGTMLGGEGIPLPFEGRPVPASPGPVGPGPGVIDRPVLVPRDTVTAYIDADAANLTGFAVPGTDIGAEYSLVVSGVAGTILSRNAYSWSAANGSWMRLGEFEAANDPDRMELQVSLAVLGIQLGPVFRVQLFASDWSGRDDLLAQAFELKDPLQLSDDGTVYSSTDGVKWKSETTIDNSLVWRDLCTGSNGYVYALERDGTVHRSTGDWTSWTRIINSALVKAVAIATDGTYFYAMESDGDTYKASSGNAWSKQGDVGASTDYEDICIDSSGNFYAVRSDTCATVSISTDGGKNWNAFGDKNVGNAGGAQTNVGIVHGKGWSSTDYVLVLQSDGNVRYDTDGKSIDPWNTTGAPGNSSGQEFVDLDLDRTTKELWTVALSGKVYTFNFSASAPDGTWNTTLGNSSATSSITAIAANLVPEFRDLAIPLCGMAAIVLAVRHRRRKGRRDWETKLTS